MKKYLFAFVAFALSVGSTTAFGQEEQTSDSIEIVNVENDTIKITAIKQDSVSAPLVVDTPILIDTPSISSDSFISSVSSDSLIVADTPSISLENTAQNEAARFGFIEAKETRRYLSNFRERRSKYEFTFKSSILRPGDVLTFYYLDIVDRKEKTKAVIYKEGVNTLLINSIEPVGIRYQGEVWISIKRKDTIIFDRVKVADNWFSVEE